MTGYHIVRNAIPARLRASALRALNLYVFDHGLTRGDILAGYETSALPAMQDAPELAAIAEHIRPLTGWQDGDRWDWPQIVMRYPDFHDDAEPDLHIDIPADWITANGGEYRTIVCVPLEHDTFLRAASKVVTVRPGDVLIMEPDEWHGRTLNFGGSVRWTVYFRVIRSRPQLGQAA
jgi:hypothetical protein